MGYRMLSATDAYWRPSTQMGVLNADLAKQLEADTMGARLWRVGPRVRRRPASPPRTSELYIVLEGTGRLRVESTVLTLSSERGPHRSRDCATGVQRHRNRLALAHRRRPARAGEHARDDRGGPSPALSRWAAGYAARVVVRGAKPRPAGLTSRAVDTTYGPPPPN
jgi:hypothetical protein